MGKDSTNSGIPVFGELINLLDKHEISKIADKLKSDRYTKRLDSYQHLVIMLYATLGQFNSLREVELGFLSSATRMNHFGLNYMVRRSTLSDANRKRTPEFFAKVYYYLYDRYRSFLSDSRPVIPDEDKERIISDEVVELHWTRRWERPMTKEELSHRRGRRPKSVIVMVKEKMLWST